MLGNGSCDLGFLYYGRTSLMLGLCNKVVIKDSNLTGTNPLSVIGMRQKFNVKVFFREGFRGFDQNRHLS